MNKLFFVLTLSSVLGCGLIAGVFFAFSTFIMRALARLQPAHGIEAMQWINRTVINPWFLGVFLGTAAVCLLLAISTLWRWHQSDAVYLLTGSSLYLMGTVLVTGVFNVPMTDALESVEPTSNDASAQWARYLTKWTAWNHVRTVAALLGAALLTLALL